MNLYESIKKLTKETETQNYFVTINIKDKGEFTYYFDTEESMDSYLNALVPSIADGQVEVVDFTGKRNINESVKVGPIYKLGTEDFITSYNDIRLDEIGITLEDIELFKRVDNSESAPDKVNYLLYISMRWDGDNTISVPISYNISDNEYEQEINPPMLGIYDEDLDSEVYDTVDEVVRNLALKISQSGRMYEFDSFNATPEEIDYYYSNEYYNKTQEETDPEKKFKNACYTAASQWMSGVTEETSKEFIEDMILPIAKRAYNSPNHSDEDYLSEIIFNLENERGIRFDFNK